MSKKDIKSDFEAQNLRNEIEYLSKLINSHKAKPVVNKVYTYRPKASGNVASKHIKQEPFKWFGNKGQASPIKKSSTPTKFTSVKANQTTFRRNVIPAAAANPYQIVKSPSKIISASVSRTKTNPAMNKTPVVLKSKYKLIKSKIEPKTLPNKQSPIKAKFKIDKISPILKKKHVLSNFKLVNGGPTPPSRNNNSFKPFFHLRRNKNVANFAAIRNHFTTGYRYSYFNSPSVRRYNTFRRNSVCGYARNVKAGYSPIKSHRNNLRNLNQKKHQKAKYISIGGLTYRATQSKLRKTVLSESKRAKVLAKGSLTPKVISVRGIKYKMGRSGKTLKRISVSPGKRTDNSSQFYHSRIDLGGNVYKLIRNGILIKSSTTQARAFASRAVNRSINRVLKRNKKLTKNNVHCTFFIRYGKCHKGQGCTFVHDPDRIAVCTRFLKGRCNTKLCPFSHKVSPDKMPACSYFLQGRCNRDNCPYRHVKVSDGAQICQPFVKGFCPSGQQCKKLHILDCPQFRAKGVCDQKGKCMLRHKKQLKRKSNVVEAPKVVKKKRQDSDKQFPSFIMLEEDCESPLTQKSAAKSW